MLFPRAVLDGIAAGRIDLAFRRRATPPAKAGGTQLTAIGLLAFDAVDEVAEITEAEAHRAGFADLATLRAWLDRGNGPIHRIRLRLAGPDPRLALRECDTLTAEDVAGLLARLDRMGPWAMATLRAIAAEPGRRAPDLAAAQKRATPAFKAGVRRLKALGLTESLDVGYRLSPRGQALLKGLETAVHPPRS